MGATSRINNSIRNAKVALIFYICNILIQFISRKIFITYLGSEVLGLNTTAQNLLGFLNLAELGIGSAIAYSLYKPLYNGNHNEVNEIVSIQGWLYRRIAYIVIIASIILMLFFPIIFKKVDIPNWYTYGSFIAFLISSLLGYFVNYKQIVLSADQKEYKITIVVQGLKLLKVFIQIFAICYLKDGYFWWIIIEILMSFVTSIVLNKEINKEYKWLKTDISKGNVLRKKYPDILTKTKQLFFHKIGSFVLTQTTPIIIYAFSTLTMVAIYGNYILIINGITTLLNAIYNGVNSSVGNLVAEGNKKNIKRVFWETTVFRVWIASFICFGIYTLSEDFIILWVGKDFILPQETLIILICLTYLNSTRNNDLFINAYGLFGDIWAPIIESILNLSISILLGLVWGLSGIILGGLISTFLVIHIWKPFYLYTYGFKDKISEYLVENAKYLTFIFTSFIFGLFITNNYFKSPCNDYIDWILKSIEIMTTYIFISFLIFFSCNKYFRNIVKRFIIK